MTKKLNQLSLELAVAVVNENRGNVSKSAKMLGIARSTLRYQLLRAQDLGLLTTPAIYINGVDVDASNKELCKVVAVPGFITEATTLRSYKDIGEFMMENKTKFGLGIDGRFATVDFDLSDCGEVGSSDRNIDKNTKYNSEIERKYYDRVMIASTFIGYMSIASLLTALIIGYFKYM